MGCVPPSDSIIYYTGPPGWCKLFPHLKILILSWTSPSILLFISLRSVLRMMPLHAVFAVEGFWQLDLQMIAFTFMRDQHEEGQPIQCSRAGRAVARRRQQIRHRLARNHLPPPPTPCGT